MKTSNKWARAKINYSVQTVQNELPFYFVTASAVLITLVTGDICTYTVAKCLPTSSRYIVAMCLPTSSRYKVAMCLPTSSRYTVASANPHLVGT